MSEFQKNDASDTAERLESQLTSVKKQMADLGLKLAVYSIGNDFCQGDAAARAKQLDDLKDGVDTAKALGVNLVRVFSGHHKENFTFVWILL